MTTTAKRIVRHVNQQVTEYYIHDSIYGWLPVPQEVTNDWTIIPLEYDYIELHHNMPNKGGLYGHHVIG